MILLKVSLNEIFNSQSYSFSSPLRADLIDEIIDDEPAQEETKPKDKSLNKNNRKQKNQREIGKDQRLTITMKSLEKRLLK